uniref:Uncharacterized protein n=1 Tax=Quercus lobata TaxID=97700 RepID=A0A7N2N2M0_QUELO
MASIFGICSSSPSLKSQKPLLRTIHSLRHDSLAFPTRLPPKLANQTQFVAREISAELSSSSKPKPGRVLRRVHGDSDRGGASCCGGGLRWLGP